jgi:hypothetical protein
MGYSGRREYCAVHVVCIFALSMLTMSVFLSLLWYFLTYRLHPADFWCLDFSWILPLPGIFFSNYNYNSGMLLQNNLSFLARPMSINTKATPMF